MIQITSHAKDKAKERFKWKNKTLERMAKKAFEEGMTHADTKSKLTKYLNRKWKIHKVCNNPRIYGENVFFFHDDILITLYRLPQELIKYTKI
jgi:hypothetical protein